MQKSTLSSKVAKPDALNRNGYLLLSNFCIDLFLFLKMVPFLFKKLAHASCASFRVEYDPNCTKFVPRFIFASVISTSAISTSAIST